MYLNNNSIVDTVYMNTTNGRKEEGKEVRREGMEGGEETRKEGIGYELLCRIRKRKRNRHKNRRKMKLAVGIQI